LYIDGIPAYSNHLEYKPIMPGYMCWKIYMLY